MTIHHVRKHRAGRKRHREGLDPEESNRDVDCSSCGDGESESDICYGGERCGDEHEDEPEFRLVDAVVVFRHELHYKIGAVAGDKCPDESDAEKGEVGEADLGGS